MPPSEDMTIISEDDKGLNKNNNEEVVVNSRTRTNQPRHSFSARLPIGLSGQSQSQQRPLLCRLHSVPAKCVPQDDEEIPVTSERLKLRDCSKQQLLVLLVIALSNFLSSCSMSILSPFFPKEAHSKGMSISLSGYVFSFYALIVSLTALFLGKMMPKLGTKRMYICGLILASVSNCLFGLLPLIMDYTLFTVMAFFVRGLEAFGASAFSTSSFVFVVETFPDNINTILGVMEVVIGLGMSVGPAIGGILYTMGGFGLPFYILGGLMFAVMPVALWILPSTSSGSKDKATGSIWKLIKIPAVFIVALIIGVSSIVWSFLDPVLEPHLETFSLDSKHVGFVFLLISSLYATSSLLWGWVADVLHNHWSMMAIGMAISTVGLLVLGPSPYFTARPNDLWVDLVALSVLGISEALTLMPTYQAIVNFAVEKGHKPEVATYSLVAGVWSSMYSLGEMIGPTIGGLLLEKYGFPVLTTAIAYSTLLMTIITILFFTCQFMWSDKKSSKDDDKKPLLDNNHSYYGTENDSHAPALAHSSSFS